MSETIPDDDNDPVATIFELLITLLIPFFYCPAANIGLARAQQAAIAALDGYGALSVPELIIAAQVIGFSMTSLGSLGLSMEDNTSPTMLLRLRGNANALSRSSTQQRQSLTRTRAEIAETREKWLKSEKAAAEKHRRAQAAAANGLTEPQVLASVAEVQQMAAEAQTRFRQHAQAAQPTQPAPEPAPAPNPAPAAAQKAAQPAAPNQDQQRKFLWGAAMAQVAAEEAANLSFTSPEEREAHAARLASLASAARQLLSEANTPPPPPPT